MTSRGYPGIGVEGLARILTFSAPKSGSDGLSSVTVSTAYCPRNSFILNWKRILKDDTTLTSEGNLNTMLNPTSLKEFQSERPSVGWGRRYGRGELEHNALRPG
jgi:hypothetical protein